MRPGTPDGNSTKMRASDGAFFPCNNYVEETKTTSFENVLEELGTLGRYQLGQLFLLCLTKGITTNMMFSFVFIGYDPPYVCNAVNETEILASLQLHNYSTVFIAYHPCGIDVYINDSEGNEKVSSMSCPSGRIFSGGKYTSILTEWDLVCESTGISELVGLLFALGQIVGGLIASVFADKFGRKKVFLSSSVAICLLETAIIFAPNVYSIVIVRFMSGIFQEGLICSAFVLAMEHLTPRCRTIYGITECVVWIFCTLLVGALAYCTQDYGWRGFQIGTALLGSFFPFYLLFIKESPRWLANNNKITEALEILKSASKQNQRDFVKVKSTFLDYISTMKTGTNDNDIMNERTSLNNGGTIGGRRRTGESKCTAQFCSRTTIILTSISSFVWMTNNLTYYGMYMTSSTLSGDRFLNFTLMALTEIPSNMALYVMMLRMGRRKIMAIFLSLAVVSLLICSLVETFSEQVANYETVSILFFLIGKFAVTSSFNVIYIYTPEIYPTNIRTIGFGLCISISRIGSLVVPYFRAFYNAANWGPAVTFCAMCAIALVFIPILPEMKDINLHDSSQEIVGMKNQSEANGNRKGK